MMIEAKELREEGARDMRYETRVPKGVLGVSIWDEVHKLKNYKRVMILTASPFMRRLRDLTSILEVVHDTSLSSARGVERLDISDTTVEDFYQLHEKLVACGSSYLYANAETRVELYGALDPRAYSQLMTSWDDAPTVVRKVVPAPLAILGLRRVTG
ncbi:hypothetical protein LTR56_025365 [Elasticomyces elasticus]|nr:hypothetical protein LTR56_025365 [Elasticomyces elasticus]KAK3655280.1 hypothetical protein LTR22_010310 [Elasticomyces elasticus]KAK5748831.1 hypothetical protein LTS12_021128 [Elasticomyces elasticus]